MQQGDSYEFGWYDGKNFVKRSDVIIVAPNYRVGPLGYLATPELQDEDPNRSTGNYGFQDQVCFQREHSNMFLCIDLFVLLYICRRAF